MEIFFHVSWRRSFDRETFCDQSIINSGTLIGEGQLRCLSGCSGTISSMSFICTDFSIEEDWTFGERLLTHTFDGGPDITIGFTGIAWIAPFNSGWSLTTSFSTSIRNDTGRINSSPRTITSPVLRLQAGCNHIIRIPLHDPENDTVRCRWSVGSECGGICNGFPGAELDSEKCSINYNATQGPGFRAAAIMIEDFITGSMEALSSVGLQFLVLVFNSETPCSAAPEFISPTPNDGSCVAIPAGETYHTMLIAVSSTSGDRITEIQTVSPAGMVKSDLFYDEDSNSFYVNITWTPSSHQENDSHLFCYTATNSAGLSTNQVCIELLSGYTAPAPLQETATPNMKSVPPFGTTWRVQFNKNVVLPSTAAFITFHELDTGVVVYRIDSSFSSDVAIKNGTILVLTPNYIFEEVREYYINFEQGVVVSLDGCRPENEPVTKKDFWVFTTLDVTPPTLQFLNNPTISNANISITWMSNEDVTWLCSLNTELQRLEQNCSEGLWNGFNLSGGVYSLEVSGTDMAENVAVIVHTFTIDDTPPFPFFIRIPTEFSNKESFHFRFSCNENCMFQCQFHDDSSDTEAVSFPCNSGDYITPLLSHGRHYLFSVTATDEVGNIGEPVSHSWETDFEAPILFGVMNMSALCTSDLSPTQTGQARAVDNRTSIEEITFSDQMTECSIRRAWRATDSAGNMGFLIQFITLEFSPALNFVPQVSVPCDSSTNTTLVPSHTAQLQNPCRRPMQLNYEDAVPINQYMCPAMFLRNWTVTDECNQETSSFKQTISLYDLCPIDACGRNESTPRGICVQGSCICSDPWFGDNCEILIYSVHVMSVNDSVLHEYEDYSEQFTLVQGTPPFIFSLISSPNRMVIRQQTGDITWRRAQAGNYTITVEITNQVSSQRVSWLLYVKAGYDASLEPISQTIFPRATTIELMGHVEYIEGNRVQELLNGFVPITIDISSRNGKRVLNVFSHQDGTFAAVFYPAPTEYGSYTAGAKHPQIPQATEQTSWDFLGIKAIPRVIRLRDSTVAEYERTFYSVCVLTNDGPRTLHGVSAVASLGNTDDLNIVINLNGSSTLQRDESAYIDIEVEH